MLAMSVGLSIFDRCSLDGGIGRSSKIGVSTSPGKIVVIRIPFSRSSSVALVPSAVIANLLALYATPPNGAARLPEVDDIFMISPVLWGLISFKP